MPIPRSTEAATATGVNQDLALRGLFAINTARRLRPFSDAMASSPAEALAVGHLGVALFGEQGDDNIDGGSGNDELYGGEGHDTLYGGEEYQIVKKTYDPDSRFHDLYAKAVQRR